MDSMQPKKLIIINILDILKKYTDEDHRLNQKEIAEILKTEYDMKVDRKAVKRNLMNLIEFGFEIEYSEAIRMIEVTNEKGEKELVESYILSDFYLVRDFTDSELRLLIDSLLFSKHIPYSQCKELIEKIESLSNRYFKNKVKHIRNLPENLPQNKELFYTIEVLDEAISKGRQVSFKYNRYGTDKKLHPRQSSSGEDRVYIINPYQMVATNGRYYLVCNYDKYDNIANYRIDMITDIKLLDSPTKPKKQVKGLEAGLDLPKHMAEHIYMFAGDSIRAKFKAKNYIIDQLIDWFGKDVDIKPMDNEECLVTVNVNKNAFLCWALQYGQHISILEPADVRTQLIKNIKEILQKYE